MWLAILFVILGPAFPIAAWLALRSSRREFSWTQVPGTISVSSVTANHHPDVAYWFVYEGRRYYGLRLYNVDFALGTPGWARRVAGQFPVGAEVKVYVDPENPQESVLIPGGNRRSFGSMCVMGGFFVIWGILALRKFS